MNNFMKGVGLKLIYGIGLNTGVWWWAIWVAIHTAYTVMGDTVNLGSRLEGLTKQYGVRMIVSESTKVAAPQFAYRELDCVRVKGKNKPIAIYEPIGEIEQVTPLQQHRLTLVARALAFYRQQPVGSGNAAIA
jgi:adenylate cyclase